MQNTSNTFAQTNTAQEGHNHGRASHDHQTPHQKCVGRGGIKENINAEGGTKPGNEHTGTQQALNHGGGLGKFLEVEGESSFIEDECNGKGDEHWQKMTKGIGAQ